MEGSPSAIEGTMNIEFPKLFGFVPDKITVIYSKDYFTDYEKDIWVGGYEATIVIDGDVFSYLIDFGAQHEYSLLHRGENNEWYDASDFKYEEAIKMLDEGTI